MWVCRVPFSLASFIGLIALDGAVIFGLSFATLLTLLVIPVCYSLAYAWSDRPKK